MYCKVCGSLLGSSDEICRVCGTVVNADTVEDMAGPIQGEGAEKMDRGKKEPVHNSEFTWNIYDFPKPKKTEDIDFHWSVEEERKAEERKRRAALEREKEKEQQRLRRRHAPLREEQQEKNSVQEDFEDLSELDAAETRQAMADRELQERDGFQPHDSHLREDREPLSQDLGEAAAPFERQPASDSKPTEKKTAHENQPDDQWDAWEQVNKRKPDPALEQELFQEMNELESCNRNSERTKFFTFTQKNEEFQRLLDREYEKIKRNAEGFKPALEAEKQEESSVTRDTIPVSPRAVLKAASKAGAASAPFMPSASQEPTDLADETADLSAEGPSSYAMKQSVQQDPAQENRDFGEGAEERSKKTVIETKTETESTPATGEAKEHEEHEETTPADVIPLIDKQEEPGHAEPALPIEDSQAESDGSQTQSVIETRRLTEAETEQPPEQPNAAQQPNANTPISQEAFAYQETAASSWEAKDSLAEPKDGSAEASEEDGLTQDENVQVRSGWDEYVARNGRTRGTEPAGRDQERTAEPEPLWFELEPEEEKGPEKEKKALVGKIVLIVIIALLLLEIGALGIQYFLPESSAAQAITQVQMKMADGFIKAKDAVLGIFGADKDNDQDAPEDGSDINDANDANDSDLGPASDSGEEDILTGGSQVEVIDPKPAEDKNRLIEAASAENHNIQVIRANARLAYESGKKYDMNGVADSVPIENNIWETLDDGTVLYYDQEVVSTLVAYDSQWVDYVNGGSNSVIDLTKKDSRAYRSAVNYSKVGKIHETFLLLEIGEIRQNGTDFYAWTYEQIKVKENGSEKTREYHWIYQLEAVDGEMKIVDFKAY